MTAAIFKLFSLSMTEKIAVDTYRLDEVSISPHLLIQIIYINVNLKVDQDLQWSAATLVQTVFRRMKWRRSNTSSPSVS